MRPFHRNRMYRVTTKSGGTSITVQRLISEDTLRAWYPHVRSFGRRSVFKSGRTTVTIVEA